MLRLARAEAPQFLRFAFVGGTGFAIDAAILALLHYGAGLDPFSARVISIVIATFATWRLNRSLTFGASVHSQAHEALRYATVAAFAAGVNYLVYALVLLIWRGTPPIVALVFGAGAAMLFSYAGYSRVVFGSARAVIGAESSQSR
jgi:putative flippase GtrA